MKKEKQEKSESKTRILVNDHPVAHRGLIQLINHEPDLVVSAEAENAAQALVILEKESVDITVVDIYLFEI